MSDKYTLSLNYNNLHSLSQKLKGNSEYFKDLAYDIKSLYWKLDWQTASKENLYGHLKNASESAVNLYIFLSNASKALQKISEDFENADKKAAEYLSKEAAHLRAIIRQSGIRGTSSNPLTEFFNNVVKMFFGDDRYKAVPISPVPKCIKYTVSGDFKDSILPFTVGFDVSKFGINPLTNRDSRSNVINFYLNTIILSAITFANNRKFTKSYKMTDTGISIIRIIENGEIYHIITGDEAKLSTLGVQLPTDKIYGLARGQDVPDDVMRHISLKSDELRKGLAKAGKKYRLKLKQFKSSYSQLIAVDNSILKVAKGRLTVETLNDLKSTLDSFSAKMVEARMTLIKKTSSDARSILTDLNKNFKVKAVLKEIDSSLWNSLPRIDMLEFDQRLKINFKNATSELVQNLKLINPWAMIKSVKNEIVAIFSAGGFVKGLAKFCKSSAILTCIGIFIDIGFDLTDDKNDDGSKKRWDDYLADVIVDIGFGIACAAASTFLTSVILGAGIGTCFPIPVLGTIVGAAIGIAVGFFVVLCTEAFEINGISLKTLTKDLTIKIVNFVANIGEDIGESLGKVCNSSIDLIADKLSETKLYISSLWDNLLGGHKSHTDQSIPIKPSIEDYNAQMGNLKPMSIAVDYGTNFTFGDKFKNRYAN